MTLRDFLHDIAGALSAAAFVASLAIWAYALAHAV